MKEVRNQRVLGVLVAFTVMLVLVAWGNNAHGERWCDATGEQWTLELETLVVDGDGKDDLTIYEELRFYLIEHRDGRGVELSVYGGFDGPEEMMFFPVG